MAQYYGDLFLDMAELRLSELRSVADKERRAREARDVQPRQPWYSFLISRPIARPDEPMMSGYRGEQPLAAAGVGSR